MQVSYIMKPNGTISLMIDGKMKSVENTHINYSQIVDKLNKEDYNDILSLIDTITAVKEILNEQDDQLFTVSGNHIIYKDYTLNEFMSSRILSMMNQKMNLKPLANFIDKLYQNPSYRAVNSLYEFLEYGGIPLAPNGNFLVYKKIRADYKDIHSGKFDNSVGTVVKMHRFEVDENPENTCSFGLHVCSFDYLRSFGNGTTDRVVICEVNPKDVVAIPKDYNNTKMRVCEYKVVGELDEKTVDALRDICVSSDYCDEDEDDEYNDDYEDTYREDDYSTSEIDEEIKLAVAEQVAKLGEELSEKQLCSECGNYLDQCQCEQKDSYILEKPEVSTIKEPKKSYLETFVNMFRS